MTSSDSAGRDAAGNDPDSGDGTLPVQHQVSGPVATIRLTNPARRNALSTRSLRLLGDAFDEVLDDRAVRVIVLAAEGPAFCAGADLNETSDPDFPGLFAAVLETMRDSTKPIVVRVQGAVRAGGIGLVAAGDIAVASADASFAFSEVRVGVVPAIAGSACLRRMQRADAAELMLTGEPFDAERAQRSGLVQHVVQAWALDRRVTELAGMLLRGSPTAIAVARQLVRDLPGMDDDEAMSWTIELTGQLFAGPDAEEGRAAFAARRDPSWVDSWDG